MLVSKKHRKLLMHLREPERVTTVIPSARTLQYKGHTLVAVPHRLDEVRVLRNLGFDPPAPVAHYYDYPGRMKPFAHQRTTVEFLTTNPRAFCLNGMGSGKTISVLWAFDFLRKAGLVRRMLVVSPLSTLERAWGDEIFNNFPDMTFAVLHGTRAKRHKLLEQDYDVFIINHDGVKAPETMMALAQREGIDLVVVDEVASFRNGSTERWKALNRIINGDPKRGLQPKAWAWGLTGTPTPNAPTDAWGQCRLIEPTSVPRYFGQFRDLLMKPLGPYRWVPREGALEVLHRSMQPAIRFAREDCIDLPPTTYVTRQTELTSEQKQAFDEMLRKLRAEHNGGQITAVNEAVKLNKLLQICCLRYDTEVLTSRGWVQIHEVSSADRVWDGAEWVAQGGACYMGVKQVIDCVGVLATPDHKVLSTRGWVTAEELAYGNAGKGLDWAEVRLPDGAVEGRHNNQPHQEGDVALPVRLRVGGCPGEPVPSDAPQADPQALRVPPRQHDARDVQDPPIPDLGEPAAEVCRSARQGLAQVRRAWDRGVRKLAGVFRELLVRYASRVRPEPVDRPHRQRRALLAGELPVGVRGHAGGEQAIQPHAGNPSRADDAGTSGRGLRAQANHPGGATGQVQVAPGKGAGYAPVFDLLDCGPRNRFVVRGRDGNPRIVHNCGVAYGANGSEVAIPAKPRIELVREIIEEAEAKVLVFVPLTAALKVVAEELSKDYTVAVVHGETSKSQRDQIFQDFQQAKDPRVLVANSATLSHGLTLTAADTVIWFAPVHSNETYQQANARVTRPGQKRNTLIVNIEATPIERKIYDRLQGREKMQGLLLELLKGG